MTPEPSIEQSIGSLKQEILNHLEQSKMGASIDISLFPQRLLDLHEKVKAQDNPDKSQLTESLKEVLEALDLLAAEIRLKYDELSTSVDNLEGTTEKNKE
ncbi:hypothetical protein [Sneathiella sp.]|jgi:hypothetical protein|uniref:hypothetical protein n=1 Tax=Sneathiella sp. TaxID=1964365 RepID=UPI0039E30D3B